MWKAVKQRQECRMDVNEAYGKRSMKKYVIKKMEKRAYAAEREAWQEVF